MTVKEKRQISDENNHIPDAEGAWDSAKGSREGKSSWEDGARTAGLEPLEERLAALAPAPNAARAPASKGDGVMGPEETAAVEVLPDIFSSTADAEDEEGREAGARVGAAGGKGKGIEGLRMRRELCFITNGANVCDTRSGNTIVASAKTWDHQRRESWLTCWEEQKGNAGCTLWQGRHHLESCPNSQLHQVEHQHRCHRILTKANDN